MVACLSQICLRMHVRCVEGSGCDANKLSMVGYWRVSAVDVHELGVDTRWAIERVMAVSRDMPPRPEPGRSAHAAPRTAVTGIRRLSAIHRSHEAEASRGREHWRLGSWSGWDGRRESGYARTSSRLALATARQEESEALAVFDEVLRDVHRRGRSRPTCWSGSIRMCSPSREQDTHASGSMSEIRSFH